MNQSGVSPREPVILGAANVALIEDAVRALEDFNDHSAGPLVLLVLPTPGRSRPLCRLLAADHGVAARR